MADMLVSLDEWAFRSFKCGFRPGSCWPGLQIVSGYRNEKLNREVGGAPDSYHLRCPSLAADLRFGNIEGLEHSPSAEGVWAILGGRWRWMGGRWGGQFIDPDPNHFDLGI